MKVSAAANTSSGFLLVRSCFSTRSVLQLSGKCAVTGISLEEKGGIIASVEALTEESRLLGLSSLLGLDAFDFGDLSTLNACPPSSIREGDVEFSTVIRLPELPNTTSVLPPSRKIESIY